MRYIQQSLIAIFLISCNYGMAQKIQIENIENENIEKLLQNKNIKFIRKNIDTINGWRYINLDAEKIDKKIVLLYDPYYTINWENETVHPNLYFDNIPLKEPQLLTDINQKLQIFIAKIGNDKIIDDRELNIFDNNQVMDLKKKLDYKYGLGKLVAEESYNGNVYLWKNKNNIIRLSIENECLCKKAKIYTKGEEPMGGRYGELTIYYNNKPEFYLKEYNYPE